MPFIYLSITYTHYLTIYLISQHHFDVAKTGPLSLAFSRLMLYFDAITPLPSALLRQLFQITLDCYHTKA